MKKKILISVLLCIAVLTAGLTGCMKKDEEEAPVASPFSILQTKVAAIEGWQGGVNTQLADKPTRAEMDAAIKAGVAIPDLAPLKDRVTAAEVENVALKADLDALEARLDELVEEGVIDEGVISGKVTAEFSDESPLVVWSTPTDTSPTFFFVRVSNGTSKRLYVNYQLGFRCVAYGGGVAEATLSGTSPGDDPTLVATNPWGLVYGCSCEAGDTKVRYIQFFPTGDIIGIPVGAGESIEIRYQLAICTDSSAQWEGNIVIAGTSETYWY